MKIFDFFRNFCENEDENVFGEEGKGGGMGKRRMDVFWEKTLAFLIVMRGRLRYNKNMEFIMEFSAVSGRVAWGM